MITGKQKRLILYLMEQEAPCTAATLAQNLDISAQSVKMYVKEINSLTKNKIILSSNKGYTLVKQNCLPFLEDQTNIPQNYMERSVYIIKEILIDHRILNVFDLCDELLISYSTLKSHLAKMNTTFQSFRIHFATKDNVVQLQGAEKDKRSLLSSIILQETNNCVLDLKLLKQSFDKDDIEKISRIINDFFKKGTYNINNFSYINLMLHFSILIERVKSGYCLSEIREIISIDNEDLELLESLSARIETDFHITLNAYEKNEIYVLFKTKTNYCLDSNKDDIKKAIGEQYLDTIQTIIEEVSELYSINLNHDSFIIPFGLHIKALIPRAALKKYNKNPLAEELKADWPIIYDIAIFFALRLSEIYHVEVIEDEVAFIFLHIGTELDRQNSANDKIKCVLLSPDYLGMEKKVYDFLMEEFSNDISIEANLSSYDDLEDYAFDLLITLMKDERNYNYPSITVSPFRLDRQKKELHEKIYEIQQSRKTEIISANFDNFFHEDLFFMLENTTQMEVIHIICDKMQSLGFVTSSFKDHVLEREKNGSTSFGNIAIPHSIHMDALQTKIGIVISKNGIEWGHNTVNVILLIAMNKLDSKILYTINEYILFLLENQNVFSDMKSAKSLEEFKAVVFSHL